MCFEAGRGRTHVTCIKTGRGRVYVMCVETGGGGPMSRVSRRGTESPCHRVSRRARVHVTVSRDERRVVPERSPGSPEGRGPGPYHESESWSRPVSLPCQT